MNRRFARIVSLAAVLAAPAQADVVGEVIASSLYYSTNTAVMSATNGGQYSEVPCGSDLTHGGSPRYFLEMVHSGYLLPDGYEGNELVAADEECLQPIFITDTRNMRFSTTPHWSPDGTRIAVYGERWDLAGGSLLERGVFVMDVIHDSTGRPVGTENLRLIIPLSGESLLSWSGDGEWLVYNNAASDGDGGEQSDLFVFDLVSEASFNVTNTPDASELEPCFSPTDDRIAYSRLVLVRGSYRWDIFTVDALSGAVVQVTSKKTTGASSNRRPSFSPDGQQLSFSSGSSGSPLTRYDIYRIRSDGSGKAVNLTGKRDGDFRYHVWRR